MNIKKNIFQTHWIAWIVLSVIAEIVVTGGFFSFSFYLSNVHETLWSVIFAQFGVMSLGLPFLFLFDKKSCIVSSYKKKEQIYKLKNLFFLSKKEINSGVELIKIEKEKEL